MLQFLNLLQTRGFIAGGRLAGLVSVQQFSSRSQISDLTKFPVVCLGLSSARVTRDLSQVSQVISRSLLSSPLSSLLSPIYVHTYI